MVYSWTPVSTLVIILALQPAAILAARRKSYKSVASSRPDDDLDEIIVIGHDTPEITKLKIAKSKAFKRMWPLDCGGQSLLHQPLALETNGFLCTKLKTVAEITNVAWNVEDFSRLCCHKECMERHNALKQCGMEDQLSLPDAAAAASQAIQKLNRDDDGDSPDIELDQEEGDIDEEGEGEDKPPTYPDSGPDGEDVEEPDTPGPPDSPRPTTPPKPVVIQKVELKFGERALNFKPGLAELDDSSQDFFKACKSNLAAVLSMKLTALQARKPRILLCAHAATSAVNQQLVDARAKTMNDAIVRENLITESIGEIGEPLGHTPHENDSDFGGGRYGSIIMKFYESDKPKPVCEKKDLYSGKYLFKFKNLVGDWEPLVGSMGGKKVPVPVAWEDKKIMIKRKGFTPNVYMQMFKGSHKNGFKAKSEATDTKCAEINTLGKGLMGIHGIQETGDESAEGFEIKCSVKYKYKHYSWFSGEDEHELTMLIRPSFSVPGAYTMKVTDINLSQTRYLPEKQSRGYPVETLFLRNMVGAKADNAGADGNVTPKGGEGDM